VSLFFPLIKPRTHFFVYLYQGICFVHRLLQFLGKTANGVWGLNRAAHRAHFLGKSDSGMPWIAIVESLGSRFGFTEDSSRNQPALYWWREKNAWDLALTLLGSCVGHASPPSGLLLRGPQIHTPATRLWRLRQGFRFQPFLGWDGCGTNLAATRCFAGLQRVLQIVQCGLATAVKPHCSRALWQGVLHKTVAVTLFAVVRISTLAKFIKPGYCMSTTLKTKLSLVSK
jgi:hypothetical protein